MRFLLLNLCLFLFISCEHTQNPDNSNLSSFREEIAEEAVIEALNAPPPPASKEINAIEPADAKIIKTANLRFETSDLEKTQAQIMGVIQRYNGYVQSDNSGKNYAQHYHNLSLRVPTQNFQNVLDDISKGVTQFDEKTISQQDVTEEFVDIQARLKAKRALEDRYLSLLVKAKNVKEMLEIERELSKIREQIERAEGRLKYLGNKVSMSTLHIQFYKTIVETKTGLSYGNKLTNALKNGWNGITSFFIGLVSVWPFIILVILSIVILRRYAIKRKQ